MIRRRRTRPSEAVAENQPIPSGPIDDAEAEALRAAIELRGSQPAADLPRAEFVEQLHRQLADDGEASSAPRVGRRAMLATAGAVAAGVVGAVADRTLLQPGSHQTPTAEPLRPTDGTWMPVATTDEVAATTVRFTTAGMIGYVSEKNGALVAVSGTCTHQGCVLRLNQAEGRLDCPCHTTAFAPDGRLLFHQLESAPGPLPHLEVRRRDGQVEVLLPPGEHPQQS